MIIKSMSRKSKTFEQLLRYVNAPAAVGPAWLHNLQAQEDDLDEIRRTRSVIFALPGAEP